jgi:maleylacetoacetate isomerase
MTEPVALYDYWRSSASYRVRIGLNLLGIAYETIPVDLLSGEHRSPAYRDLNPQAIVPTLKIDGEVLTQSIAIMEYLHARTPGSTLLPQTALGQFRARQLAFAIAMEIHPICNLRVAGHVADLSGNGDATKQAWMQHYIGRGLAAVEELLVQGPVSDHAASTDPSIVECCLIPQLYNADRWGVDYRAHPNILHLREKVVSHPAFLAAHPDAVRPAVRGV